MNKSRRNAAVRQKTPSPSLASIATDLQGIPDPAFIEQLERSLINLLSEPPVNAVLFRKIAGATRNSPDAKVTRG
jgi:hypothetical protein